MLTAIFLVAFAHTAVPFKPFTFSGGDSCTIDNMKYLCVDSNISCEF